MFIVFFYGLFSQVRPQEETEEVRQNRVYYTLRSYGEEAQHAAQGPPGWSGWREVRPES